MPSTFCSKSVKMLAHALLLLLVSIQHSGQYAVATSALAAEQQDNECSAARQRFRSAALDHLLSRLLSADVVLESEAMADADKELYRQQSVTVPVRCFHKGHLTSAQVPVGLHQNYTRCIHEHILDAEFANGRHFVFFLRRLDNGSFVLLEGGVARTDLFNEMTSPVCDLQSQHTAAPMPCKHLSGNKCEGLEKFLTLIPDKLTPDRRQAYIQPADGSERVVIRHAEYDRSSGKSAATAANRCCWSVASAALLTVLAFALA